jgi:hypothetical protein
MRIAFDLDGTLTPIGIGQFSASVASLPMSLFFREPLRDGAVQLMRELSSNGHELWIYTSSLRTRFYIWLWFLSVGVRLKGVVNGDVHAKITHGKTSKPSKFPPAFGIDILVDDSVGVEIEGRKHGFRVLTVLPCDSNWTHKVIQAVQCPA